MLKVIYQTLVLMVLIQVSLFAANRFDRFLNHKPVSVQADAVSNVYTVSDEQKPVSDNKPAPVAYYYI